VHITVAGVDRHALIERPTAGAHKLPLIIFLHGSKSSGQAIRDELAIDSEAASAGVLVAYPDGDPGVGSWAVGCCNAFSDSRVDFTFLADLIHTLVADGEADPRHIVMGGFSAGGLMANSFACEYPQLLRAVVSVAGSLLEPPSFVQTPVAAPRCTPQQPVTILEIHGAADTTSPIAGSTAECHSGPCGPGVNGYLEPAAVINSWWRQLDSCPAPPASHVSGGAVISLSMCAGGSYVGLALIPGVGHSLPELEQAFGLHATLLDLALGKPVTPW
jgi:polyhydroxybutyrate depolymerase